MHSTEASNSTKQIYGATGVQSCKLTHHRTSTLQYCGFNGMNPWQINSMTKHILEKMFSAYGSVTEREICKILAGFKRDEEYYPVRCQVELQHSVPWYCSKLLPGYNDWLRQQASDMGDKTQTCQKFLYHVLPYLVRVVVQDGIYFIVDFPNHPMSHYLKVRTKKIFFVKATTNQFSSITS